MAAVYRTAGHPDSYYRDVNVGGTERLLEAAAAAGVRRFVHTSTVGVHGARRASAGGRDARRSRRATSTRRRRPRRRRWRSSSAARRGLPVAVVRPGAIYGPGETRLLKLFRAIARGRYAIVGLGPRVLPPRLHRRPAWTASCWRSSRREAVGEAFIVAGPRYVTQRELADADRARDRRARAAVPRARLAAPGWRAPLCEAVCVPLGIEPPLHRRRVEFWTKSRAFSIDKARRLLGYAPKVDLDEGVRAHGRVVPGGGWL